MKRINFSTGTPWEKQVGYSRAVRVGNLIEVSGTVAVDEQGQLVGGQDPFAQTCFILKKIRQALEQAGGNLTQVIRTRYYVTDISCWEAIGRAHAQFFLECKPCMTLVEVSGLIGPDYLVEVEATAWAED